MLSNRRNACIFKRHVVITTADSKDCILDKSMIGIEATKITKHGTIWLCNYTFSLHTLLNHYSLTKIVVDITPNVIEPSFGFDRIFYKVLEHSYYTREDEEQRAVFKFPPSISPYKVTVFPLSKTEDLCSIASSICECSFLPIAHN